METLHVSIRNWKGCTSAEFDIAPKGVQLIQGFNESGKTSILQALGYTLSNVTMKPERRQLHTGRGGKCECKISIDEERWVKLALPSGKKTTQMDIKVSAVAAGLVNVLSLKTSDRLSVLSQHLDSEPTFEDFDKRMKREGWTDDEIEKVWKDIKEGGPTGWNARLDVAVSDGVRLKGQWREAAASGENWGIGQSEGWMPAGMDKELMKASQESLEKDYVAAKDDLEAKIASRAVDDEEVRKLHEKWLEKDTLIGKVQLAKDEVAEKEKALEALREEYSKLPSPDKPVNNELMICGHCGGLNVMENSKWVGIKEKPKEDEKKNEKRRAALNECQERGNQAKKDLAQAQRELAGLESMLKDAEVAHNAWIEMVKQVGGSSEEEVEQDRERATHAEKRRDIFRRWKRCTELHEAIKHNQKLIDCLKPDGLALDKLGDAIKVFNEETLKPICELAGWGMVELHQDMDITWDGINADPICESELYRANITMQIAIASHDGSAMVLIDRLDMFDDIRREQLVSLLENLDLPAVCAKTEYTAREYAADIAPLGLGTSYWMEKGRLSKIGAGK